MDKKDISKLNQHYTKSTLEEYESEWLNNLKKYDDDDDDIEGIYLVTLENSKNTI